MEPQEKNCCAVTKDKKNRGVLAGILYGLIPHTFCIAFIIFSIIGSVVATTFLKKFLLIPYFFQLLIIVSLLLATISSAIYLKRAGCLCVAGIKKEKKYLATLYSSTLLINLLMFLVVFPVLANTNSTNTLNVAKYPASLSMAVQIPCSGHAPLIIDELKKIVV
jgi:uncharacterized membrane protein YeaQ/YmgE (transglycosylase-associated protein family)